MIARLSSHWWLFLIRGILALALGILFPLYPGAAIYTLALLFGAYALVDGIVAIAAALRMNHAEHNWGWLLVEGVLGVLVGVITFFYPGITALWLIYLFATWAILTGIAAIVAAIRLRPLLNETLTIVLGVISLLAGISILFVPAIGALAIVWTISVYALLAGIVFIGLAFRLRGLPGRIAGTPA